METVLQPPMPFEFENSLINITSGNLSVEWVKWKSSFNIYYEACELSTKTPKTQVNILLHVIGERCREVVAQFRKEFTSIAELLARLDDFFIPKKHLAVERHMFFKRDQNGSESAEQYVFDLNKIADRCEFKELREDLVCSRLICGLNNISLSERLLREPNIKLEKALDICKLTEMARMQAMKMKVEKGNEGNHDATNVYETKYIQAENSMQVSRWPQQSAASHTRSNYSPSPLRPNFTKMYRYQVENYPPHVEQATTHYTMQRPKHINIGKQICGKCGRRHRRNECSAKGKRCSNCKHFNHFARMCRAYTRQRKSADEDRSRSFVVDDPRQKSGHLEPDINLIQASSSSSPDSVEEEGPDTIMLPPSRPTSQAHRTRAQPQPASSGYTSPPPSMFASARTLGRSRRSTRTPMSLSSTDQAVQLFLKREDFICN